MTRINRSTADIDLAHYLREEGLSQLRAALFVDDEQAALFKDIEVITLAQVHWNQRAGISSALGASDWPAVAHAALLLEEVQQGLQKLDLAEMRA